MLTKDIIVKLLESNNEKILNFGVERLGIFGSYARNEQTPESDIDFLVEFKEGQKTYDNFMDLAFLIKELFQVKTELVTPDSIAFFMKDKILKETEYVLCS